MMPQSTKRFNGKKYDLWESKFMKRSDALSKAAKLRKQGILARVVAYKDRQGQKRYAIYAS